MRASRLYKVKGFTLVELISVIVILGVLTAFALPRFSNLSQNAKISTLQAIEGNIKATMGIVHAQALIQGLTQGAAVMTLDDGSTINLVHGYPIPEDLVKVLDVSAPITTVTSNLFANFPIIVYYFSGETNPQDNSPPFPLPNQGSDCFALYSVSNPGLAPFAGTRIITNGC